MELQALNARSAHAVQQAQPVQKAQAPEKEQAPAAAPAVPDYDQYSPEKVKPSAGLYRVGHDEAGNRLVEQEPVDDGSKAEQCTVNTDRVDREIESLRREEEQLQQQLSTAAPEQTEALQRRLEQVQRELSQKDNDSYRRQNAVVS